MVYGSFFEILINNFGVSDLVKPLEVGSSSGMVESKKKKLKGLLHQ